MPPHDLDAEAAVLSAILLSRDALDSVLDVLKPEHFYSDANGRIFEAAMELAVSGSPIDIVAVASWLRDRERLALVGGPSYLAQLAEATPAVAHVVAHATIVYEKWRLRALIATCQRIAAEGYGDVGDVHTFMVTSARDVDTLALAQRTDDVMTVKQVLVSAIHRVSLAASSPQGILGVPTGYDKLDAKMAGLNDGDLTIVAARPGMGKTSFALNIAVNVASPRNSIVDGRDVRDPETGVVVFSLEMPRDQLGLRVVCSEGCVDLGKVRTNFLTPTDWSRMTEAATHLSGLPIWIDDTPGIGLSEMRAKVRRIQAAYNREALPADATREEVPARRIGLVVIDYLQLMRGDVHAASREQEVGEISRGLKGLAKELGVPIIALSQLNRSVETRSTKDKRPQLSDLRECIAGDQIVVDAETGECVTMRDIANGRPTTVYGLGHDLRVTTACVERAWSTGVKPVFRLRTMSGREVRATLNHPFRKFDGWVPLEALRIGDRIAVPREVPQHASPSYGCQGKTMCRADLARVASTLGRRDLMQLAQSDVLWDPIVSIVPDGEEEVFDIFVPGMHNFVVSGVFAHNSGAIEQDADNIIFLYRPSYYSEDAPKDLAEVIVAKQRNGPTGKVHVRFTASCTRFDNLAAGDYPEMDDEA